ncbi:MAG TPA: FG-GAP-like repeat-containing protein [Blastocatellia bacterium]|nr:FG-GAP-like repeat-containing protein [Blastocatellia bacterium]
MKTGRLLLVAALASLLLLAATFRGFTQSQPDAKAREEAYRANNIGVALLEQYKYPEAVKEFRRALALAPKLTMAQINLGIALFYAGEYDAAQREAKAAEALAPNAPQVYYTLGLIAKVQNRPADAMASFKRVLDIDPRDPGANINLGQLYKQQRDFPNAIAAFRRAIETEPYNTTALYGLGLTLMQAAQREEGQRVMAEFKKVSDAHYGTEIGKEYLEHGRYAEAIVSTGAEPELVSTPTPDVTFTDATAAVISTTSPQAVTPTGVKIVGRTINGAEWNDQAKRDLVASLGGGVTLFDYDGDGDLDLFVTSATSQKLYRNDGGKFVDVTEAAGLAKTPANRVGIAAVAGDYDNDTRPDLLVLRYGGLTLYHNDGGGKFSDVSAAAGLANYPYLALSLAFVDVDHDGDLDIFIAGCADLSKPPAGAANRQLTFPDDFAAAPNLLLRNDGNGKFTDTTAQAKLTGGTAHAVAIVPTDYDNHRDIDLLVVSAADQPALYSNQRDGTFRNVAAEVGLAVKGPFTCAAAGDVNKDGFTDFFFGRADGAGTWAMSDGRGRFTTAAAAAGTEMASAAQFIDYDNDGLLDLVVATANGLRVIRNLGNKWENTSARAISKDLFGAGTLIRALAAGDIDYDGDTDIIAISAAGEVKVAHNDGGNKNHSLRLQLNGKVSNRSAVGSKVEMRAGSLHQKLETYSASPAPAPADLIFGVGNRAAVDAVRVLWPAGILQAETELPEIRSDDQQAPLCACFALTEVDRKPSSCPFLYTWNGERFEFVTDFMGGGEMGYWEAPGQRNTPDPDEYVRIRGDQLKARDGRFELRVTNELEEVLYVDRLQLIAVAHPADTEVYPNEGMTEPPRPFKLWVTHNARPPLSAIDDRGKDVRDRLTKVDRRFVDGFTLHRIRGYAEPHTLTMNLGAATGRTVLLLTGWTDYAFSSDNVAASQSGLSTILPALQVKDGAGRWQTVIEDIGIPVGRPQTVTVDLTGKFLSASREVRIVTNMRIYWDQVLVDTSPSETAVQMTRLEPVVADLHWRGFSAETTPDGREPFGYDYARVSSQSPWKTMPGRYTREGDVRELLAKRDDLFVISRPGDEITLTFDATRLPPLPAGWKRTYLLYADGFSKEMDIHSASPDAVAPLPFHGMKQYPYDTMEHYPMTAARRQTMERYDTRRVVAPLPRIETTFAEPLSGNQQR